VLIGDDKPYVTALLVPNFEALKDLAQSLNVKYHDLEDLIKSGSIIEFYENKLEQLQQSLAGFEKIKKFTLLSQDFNMQLGELTPTLKVRRSVVLDRFNEVIETMYSFR
jgi:long-chain acyl-CoA synthetase